jgi:hypothetical protein
MKILQRIAKAESKNQCYKTFRNINTPSTGGINHLILEQNNKLTRIDDKGDIEMALQSHFSDHFNQATGTPFTMAPLNTIFGYSGVTDITQKLLNNDLHITNQSNEMQIFLQQFTRSRQHMNEHSPTE